MARKICVACALAALLGLVACAMGRDEVVASNSPEGDADGSRPVEAGQEGSTQADGDDNEGSWPAEDAGVDHDEGGGWPGDALADEPVAPEASKPSACGANAGVSVTTSDRQGGASDTVEAWLEGAPGQVITGLGLRINDDDVKTFRARFRAVLADGSLGPPTEQRAGAEPSGSLEADIDLPDCYVLVGFGARSNSGNARTLVLWGAPMSPDGSLGAVQEFRAGSEPTAGVESEFHAPAARAVTGAGLGVSSDNVDAIRSTTDRWNAQ